MRPIGRLLWRAAAFAALAGAPAAMAAPMTINFQGVVTQAVFDPFDPLSGAVQAGSPMYSYLNVDSTAADTAPSPQLGSYTVSGGTHGMVVLLANIVFPIMRTVNISVVNGQAGMPDMYTVYASEGVQDGLSDYFSMSMVLQDDSGTAFSSDALPLQAPDMQLFGLRSFNLFGQYTDLDGVFVQYEVQGEVTVPEPGTLALLAAAGMAMALLRRRRATANARCGAARARTRGPCPPERASGRGRLNCASAMDHAQDLFRDAPAPATAAHDERD